MDMWTPSGQKTRILYYKHCSVWGTCTVTQQCTPRMMLVEYEISGSWCFKINIFDCDYLSLDISFIYFRLIFYMKHARGKKILELYNMVQRFSITSHFDLQKGDNSKFSASIFRIFYAIDPVNKSQLSWSRSRSRKCTSTVREWATYTLLM